MEIMKDRVKPIDRVCFNFEQKVIYIIKKLIFKNKRR